MKGRGKAQPGDPDIPAKQLKLQALEAEKRQVLAGQRRREQLEEEQERREREQRQRGKEKEKRARRGSAQGGTGDLRAMTRGSLNAGMMGVMYQAAPTEEGSASDAATGPAASKCAAEEQTLPAVTPVAIPATCAPAPAAGSAAPQQVPGAPAAAAANAAAGAGRTAHAAATAAAPAPRATAARGKCGPHTNNHQPRTRSHTSNTPMN